jgi:hypothetical protein
MISLVLLATLVFFQIEDFSFLTDRKIKHFFMDKDFINFCIEIYRSSIYLDLKLIQTVDVLQRFF